MVLATLSAVEIKFFELRGGLHGGFSDRGEAITRE
jgi:hypothetical protein